MSKTFLSSEEVADLTDRKQKAAQIKALRDMGISFLISATGHPKVIRSAIEGRTATHSKAWQPKAPAASGWQSAAR